MEEIAELSNFLKSLSDPTRLKIVEYLSSTGKPRCVNAISQHINVSQSATSQHLRILRQISLVKRERYGYHIHYELNKVQLNMYMEQLKHILKNSL